MIPVSSCYAGESTPVRKVAFTSAGKSSYTVGDDAAHTLYSGTTVNQVTLKESVADEIDNFADNNDIFDWIC